ncbi:hypothetical protein PRIPAC_84606 [Pristionchus pacificus]|uniref:Uncharacterized protein n=1 Tax=Pristionchus pacificus TaxID=54126 RepID=A0A2A6BLZ1_PRIPA|nr:hypothetical protein PRIPAC_84606 [Pristionchus pacificus]|eukprot:PDM66925.1 hypothetical protein PRIPAC_48342 [Pristionchus pacificus]
MEVNDQLAIILTVLYSPCSGSASDSVEQSSSSTLIVDLETLKPKTRNWRSKIKPMLAVAEPVEEGVVDGLPEATQPEEARNAPEKNGKTKETTVSHVAWKWGRDQRSNYNMRSKIKDQQQLTISPGRAHVRRRRKERPLQAAECGVNAPPSSLLCLST